MNLPTLPADKAQHVIYGAAIAAVAGPLSVHFGIQPAGAVALAAAAVVGIVKEAADWLANRKATAAGLLPPHGVEWQDAAATVIGGALVALPLLVAVP